MLTRILIAALFWLSLVVSATAEDRPVVVELFTSQGCSACPPADAFLAELGARDDVIALALHVDYWDYIGWTDVFADPVHTARQQGYARTGGWRMIYTPQMVVNGRAVAVGSKRSEVQAILDRERQRPARVALRLTQHGDMLAVEMRPLGAPVGPADIHVVRYRAAETVKILRGENAGRTMAYSNVVDEWDLAARWNGSEAFRTDVPLIGDGPVAVLVQVPDHGPILAAARLR
jgi:hypothetical protein